MDNNNEKFFIDAYVDLAFECNKFGYGNGIPCTSPIIYNYVNYLNEGLVATYPLDFFVDILYKRFGCVCVNNLNDSDSLSYQMISYIDNGIVRIHSNKYLDENFLSELEKICDACGYFISASNFFNVIIESKIGTDVSKDILDKNEYLYHICPEMIADKIMKNGLEPKSSNDSFDYPDRIYLFTKSLFSIRNNVHTVLYTNKKLWYDKTLKKLSGCGDTDEYKRCVSNGYYYPKRYCILKISTEGLKNNTLFIDQNWENTGIGALYTTENIEPKWIEIERTLNVNEYIAK